MQTRDYPFKNLVFEGSGVKGVAYGGVFEVWNKTKSRRRLNHRLLAAGTSAGAVTANQAEPQLLCRRIPQGHDDLELRKV